MLYENPKARSVAKIIARVSDETAEIARNTLRHAYGRYQKEGLSFSDLVRLPDPLYQDGLIEFAKYVATQEAPEGGFEFRRRYDEYLLLINRRFAPEAGPSREEAREASQDNTDSQAYSRNAGNTANREGAAWSSRLGRFTFSFSPAAFFGYLASSFSRGSVVWLCLKYPDRGGRLIGAAALYGVGMAFVVLFILGLFLGVLDVKLPFDMALSTAVTWIAVPLTLWKAKALKDDGWF